MYQYRLYVGYVFPWFLHMKLNFDMYLKSSKIQYVLYFISVFPAVKNPLDFYKKNITRFIIQYWI